MSNLESIIRSFEEGYLSPVKKEKAVDVYKQKNFVKKIVEAFEMKYKIYNDSKTVQKIPKSPKENISNVVSILESWKRRSRIVRKPSKKDSSHSKPNNRNVDESNGSALSSEKRIFHTSCDNNGLIRRRPEELKNSKCSGKSKMILSAFGRKASGLELCSTFLRSSSDSSSPPNCITIADLSHSVKRFSADKTKTMNTVDPYMTLSKETTFTSDEPLPITSTLIDQSLKSEHNSTLPEISQVDKSPKVVGAFLKKPIDVENTFINWIPITGKRLPRKRSLKKLLCSLTSGKLVKRSLSERNLNEEPREIQDSEYDERSCSSMSLTSLISITDVLRQQESSYFEFNRRCDLKTFKSKNKSNEEKGEASCDTYHSVKNQKKKQLLLTEMPRDDVKLDLGPSYPPPSQTNGILSSLVGELVPKLPNHPDASSSVIIKNDLYEVEFRRSCSNLPSSNIYSSSSSVTSHYDVPRRFLSKSENEILRMRKSKSKLNRKEEPIYDIPKSQSIERPRSSIYDDVLSSERKGIYVEAKTNLNTRSLARCDLESHRAIAKPIDTRIYMNSQVQLYH